MNFKGKRGTDKPIEIFIALFVILAVAMVILKMFSSQIEQKKQEMEQQQQEERARMAKADLDSYCDSLCAQAHRSLKDKVTYCTSYYRGEIDINKNSIPDFTMALDNIQGYCEDRIYCAAYRPCGSLDMLTCKKITCDYIERNLGAGNSDVTKSNRLVHYNPDSDTYSGYFQPGECWSRLSSEERENHWFYHFMSVPDYMGKTSDSKCFFRWGTCLETASALQTEYDTNTWQADCIPPSGDI